MPFRRPTTTPIPDELFDYWLTRLSESEIKVLLYIMRHTLGFKKDADAISYTQFLRGIRRHDGTVCDEGALRSRRALAQALDGLEEKQLIRRQASERPDGGAATTIYTVWWADDVTPSIHRIPPQYPVDASLSSQRIPAPSSQGIPTRNNRSNKQPRERVHHPDDYTGGKYGHRVEP